MVAPAHVEAVVEEETAGEVAAAVAIGHVQGHALHEDTEALQLIHQFGDPSAAHAQDPETDTKLRHPEDVCEATKPI